MKRLLLLPFIILCAIALVLPVAAYADIPDDYEYAHPIYYVSSIGIMGGKGSGDTFRPESSITRAEMASLMLRLVAQKSWYDCEDTSDTLYFDDVTNKEYWYFHPVNWCASKGIINEFDSRIFRPNDNCTYIEALKMLCGALEYTDWNKDTWKTDVRSKANELKLTEGIPTTISDSANVTRGQLAQLVYNALWIPMKEKKIVNKEVNVGGTIFYIPTEEDKLLGIDVWGITSETDYAVIGTKNYGTSTGEDDLIVIESTVDNTREAVSLTDIGMVQYKGNSDELINLHITVIERIVEDATVRSAILKGRYIDNVEVTYSSDFTKLTVNGTVYTADDFSADSEHRVYNYKPNGAESDIAVFINSELSYDFVEQLNSARSFRVTDFDGDGYIDAIVIIPKHPYRFAILRDIEKGEPTLDETTMEIILPYYANIICASPEGKLVIKKLPLAPHIGQDLYYNFKSKIKNVSISGITKSVIEFNYTLITSYERNARGYYDISFGLLDNDTSCMILDSGADFISTKGENGLTVGSRGNISIDDNAVIFYTDLVESGEAMGFNDLKHYAKEDIEGKHFNDTTYGPTVLYREGNKYTLLATFLEEDIIFLPDMESESFSAAVGDTVTVPVKISNNPGINRMTLECYYSDHLELKSVTKGDGLAELLLSPIKDMTANPTTITLESPNGNLPFADYSNGTIVNLTFEVKDASVGSNQHVVIKVASAYNKDREALTVDNIISTVTVVDYILGDVNEDKVIDLKDVTQLRRYLAGGYGVTISSKAADVNRDGAVNLKDVTHLRRYLAGGYGVTLD